MRTLKPFHFLEPEKYLRNRYRPLFVVVTADDVAAKFDTLGVSFPDFLAAAMPRGQDRARLMDIASVKQYTFDDVVSEIKLDLMLFSQSFIFEEFEQAGTLFPELSPTPARFPRELHYGTPESRDPPWYQWALEKLLEAQMFSNYDFCDLPVCILYGTTLSGDCVGVDALRGSLALPEWMLSFVDQIPVIRIIVLDSTETVSDENIKFPKGKFNATFTLPVLLPGPPISPERIRELFKFDDEILLDAENSLRVTATDLERAEAMMGRVRAVTDTFIKARIDVLKKEENKKRLPGLVKRKRRHTTDSVMGVAAKKIRHLRLASMLYMDERTAEAKKAYKYFAASLKDGFKEMRWFGKFMKVMCFPFLETEKKKFRYGLSKVMNRIPRMRDVLFMVAIPMLFAEFAAADMEFDDAIADLRFVIENVLPRLAGRAEDKHLITALLHERLAGFVQSPKKEFFHTALAGVAYEMAGHLGHALRCSIWLECGLDHGVWKCLYQGQWLRKVRLLEELGQPQRAYVEAREMMKIGDLDESLHMDLYREFMKVVNDCHLKNSMVRVDTLFKVTGVRMVDETSPSYWGFKSGEFDGMLDDVQCWCGEKSRTRMSYRDFWVAGDTNRDEKENLPVVVADSDVFLTMTVHNKYRFDIEMTKANIEVEYDGESSDPCVIYPLGECVVKSSLRGESTQLFFRIFANAVGKYTVKSVKFVSWNAVESVIPIGPLRFVTVKDYPKISVSTDSIPARISSGDCVSVKVTVKNTGTQYVKDVILWYDNVPSLCALSSASKYRGCRYFVVSEELAPGDEVVGELMLLAQETGKEQFRLIVSVGKILRGYYYTTYSVSSHFKVDSRIVQNSKDTDNQVLHVTLRSYIDNVRVIGVMNENGKMLRALNDGDNIVNRNEVYSLAAFICDELTETVEYWRVTLLRDRQYALLLDVGGKYLSQVLLDTETKFQHNRFVFEMAKGERITVGMKVKCTVKMIDRDSNRDVYVEPLPITFENTNNKFSTVAGCKWIGVSKRKLCVENGFQADFHFMAFQTGCYHISAFVWSYGPDDINRNQAVITHVFRVAPREDR